MSLPVRFVHVLAMAILLGGAVMTWAVVESERSLTGGAVPSVAWTFERLFWVAAGLVVLTGVGNLGSLAPAVPGPDTDWGTALAAKLGLVVAVLLFSMLRTMVVWRIRRHSGRLDGTALTGLRVAYGGTTLGLLVIVGLGEVIAHG